MVTEETRTYLARPYTLGEVDVAIKEMAPLKAPGPDGMPPFFYQTYWSDVGLDYHQAVLSSINSSAILKSINLTFITLIPKVNNPEKVSDFWPISLCNVIYKIVNKVIMECIRTMSYSILVNGELKGLISLSRGLRQGNHISLYLFLFCAKGLNAIFRKAAMAGEIKGFSLCRNGPKLSHQFLQMIVLPFADIHWRNAIRFSRCCISIKWHGLDDK